MTARIPRTCWPGRPAPLGASWDGEGTNFAVYSGTADAVAVCLLDEDGDAAAVPLLDRTFNVWHGYLPGIRPGQRYGFCLPPEPALLIDPYARAIDDTLAGVVGSDAFPWGEDRRPGTPWSVSVLYELHVRGFSLRNPAVPERLRGSYAGLAHPASVDYLCQLGVTAIELLPVQQFVSEPALLQRGLVNYWGYNPIGFFAPHAAYSAGGSRGEQVDEFKGMVRALHAAGLEVILDVVYNHTAENDESGPILSFRGLDPSYYRRDERGGLLDHTGCGNTVDLRRLHVLALVMDSLRYWVQEMHVDGFRFDLAPALTRGTSFLATLGQDPVLSQVKLIAEPWDLGPGGYHLGQFPAPWTEWNDRYRDTIRDFWAGGHTGMAELGCRLSGSSDLFAHGDRRPSASINYVACHDGFTMRDLTTYEHKHNEANGDGNRDGTNGNRSWHCGIEGDTTDPVVTALRRRQVRNLLAALLLSAGVPMLSMGDELHRTQLGNNNAYCQDNETSWLDWSMGADQMSMLGLVRRLLALRRASPVLRQPTFFLGQTSDGGEVKDLAWFTAAGCEMTEDDWRAPTARTVGMYLSGQTIRARTTRGARVVDHSYLLLLHAGVADSSFRLPGRPWASGYDVLLDTSVEDALFDEPVPAEAGSDLPLVARSLVLLRVRGGAACSPASIGTG